MTKANSIFPVITLYQPWATWIMRRWKTIETRTHDRFKSLKGQTVLIHAGMTTDESAANNQYLLPEQIAYNPEEIINGYILGSCFVYDFKELSGSHSVAALIECWNTKRYGLFLENIIELTVPIEVKGEMGIWYFDIVTKQKVRKSEIQSKKPFTILNNPMTKEKFLDLANELSNMGYADEIDWQRNLKTCDNSFDFLNQTCWVILNSGMKEQIARKIWERIRDAWANDIDISEVFKHKGKVAAIKYARSNCGALFYDYVLSGEKIDFLQTIPFIGKITCYHLAKNLGHDCVKPDRHLVRVANQYNTTPDELCEGLSQETGERKCVIDIIIWRSCNLGLL